MSKEQNSDNDTLVNTIKQELDQQSNTLDSDVTDKLNTLRRQALEAKHSRVNKPYSWWQPVYKPALAASFALAATVALVLYNPVATEREQIIANDLQSDLDVVLGDEDFELMQQDLEFYLWMEDEAENS